MQRSVDTSMQAPDRGREEGIAQRARIEFEHLLHQWLLARISTMCAVPAQEAAGRPMHRYALVSAGQCEEGFVADMVAAHALSCERLLMETPEAELADIGPWLVALPESPEASLLHELASHAGKQALTVLSSPVRLPRLGEHLRSFMYGSTTDGTPVLLRYFDPRIGFDVVAHWGADIRQKFMAPLAWWAGWNGLFEPQSFTGPARGETSPMDARIALTPQWDRAIDAVGEAHFMAALLAEELEETAPHAAEELSEIHPLIRRCIASDALAFARQAQWSGWDDRALACRQALLQHARFHTHPAFEAAWRRFDGVDAVGLRQVLADLPAQVAQDWAQDREPMLVRLYEQHAQSLFSLNAALPAMARDPRAH